MSSNYVEKFAENLNQLKGDKTLREFSEMLNIPNQTLSRYLNCKRVITLDNLIKIADYFNEDIDVLIGRKEY